MTRNATIKLLLINESDEHAEQLIKLFRNAGRVVRIHRVKASDSLPELFKEEWDLLIMDQRVADFDLAHIAEQRDQSAPSLPILAICDDGGAATAIAKGAADAIGHDEEERLIHASLREVHDGELRRRIEHLEISLRDAEQRCEQLLAEASQAIAFVADGMIVETNDQFAKQFGYESGEELDFLPMIDLIDGEHHNAFKQILKKPDQATTSDFKGINKEGEPFAVRLHTEPSTFDGEPCIQITTLSVSAETINEPTVATTQQLALGPHLNELELPEESSSVLLAIDQIDVLRGRHGLHACQDAIEQIFDFAANTLGLDEWIAISQEMRALLAPEAAEVMLHKAESLCKTVADKIFEVGEQTVQVTLSAGIAPLNTTVSETIENAYKACEELRSDSNPIGVGSGARLYTPPRDAHGLRFDGDMAAALDRALEEDRFHLLYQPLMSLRGAQGDYYEVLLRMLNDQDEEVLPDNFLEALSGKGVQTKLDRWVITEACANLSEQRVNGNDTRMLINLTAHCLQDEKFLDWVPSALQAAAIPPEAVTFQFNEVDVNNYLNGAKAFAEKADSIGCKLSISRFGRTLDPLKTLKHIPAHFVKVDGGFTKDLQNDQGDPQLLGALVSAINGRGMKAIVPYVESAAVLAKLWQIGADYIQGYYLQAPQREMTYEFTDIA